MKIKPKLYIFIVPFLVVACSFPDEGHYINRYGYSEYVGPSQTQEARNTRKCLDAYSLSNNFNELYEETKQFYSQGDWDKVIQYAARAISEDEITTMYHKCIKGENDYDLSYDNEKVARLYLYKGKAIENKGEYICAARSYFDGLKFARSATLSPIKNELDKSIDSLRTKLPANVINNISEFTYKDKCFKYEFDLF